jgi:hypothetical protein
MFEHDCEHCGVHYRGMGKHFCSSLCRTLASRNRIEFACKNCGVQCERPASFAKYTAAEFCSLECWYAFAKGKGLTGKLTVEKFVCANCSKTFTARPSPAGQRYCSIKCMNIGRRGRPVPKRRVARIELRCKHCRKTFQRLACQIEGGRGLFCSRTCNASYSHDLRRQEAFMQLFTSSHGKPVDPDRLLSDADARRIFSFSPRGRISRRPGSPTARPAE